MSKFKLKKIIKQVQKHEGEFYEWLLKANSHKLDDFHKWIEELSLKDNILNHNDELEDSYNEFLEYNEQQKFKEEHGW